MIDNDRDRLCDWDEREPINRPQDDPDDWEWTCLSEEAHKRMLERAAKEQAEAMAEIRKWRNEMSL